MLDCAITLMWRAFVAAGVLGLVAERMWRRRSTAGTRGVVRAWSHIAPECALRDPEAVAHGGGRHARPRGTIALYAHGDRQAQTRFVCDLEGLPPGLHGLHVHRCGDLSRGCASTCDHYNPDGSSHGGPLGAHRHRGDLGNVTVDERGRCRDVVIADVTVDEIVGRAFVLHADADDLGQGGDAESAKTGNAGARIAGGLILPAAA